MSRARLVALISLLSFVMLASASVSAQTPSGKWTPGTIMEVKRHQTPGKTQDSLSVQWDISVKVGSTTYVVLYTELPGHAGIEYKTGMDLNVLVGPKTLKYNDILGRAGEVPIIATRPSTRRTSRDSGK